MLKMRMETSTSMSIMPRWLGMRGGRLFMANLTGSDAGRWSW